MLSSRGVGKKNELYNALALSLFSFVVVRDPSVCLTLRLGMCVCAPSPGGAEMKWWMVHMVWSSALLSHDIQWSCLASHIIWVYSFHSLQCSSWMGWSKMWRWTRQYTLRASLQTSLHLSFRSAVHHLFMNGVGVAMGTCLSMILLSVSVKASKEV